jgi:hypothetical protein
MIFVLAIVASPGREQPSMVSEEAVLLTTFIEGFKSFVRASSTIAALLFVGVVIFMVILLLYSGYSPEISILLSTIDPA